MVLVVLGVLVRHSLRRVFLSVACEIHLESAVLVVAEHTLERDTSVSSTQTSYQRPET